jgi:hypothetical protein
LPFKDNDSLNSLEIGDIQFSGNTYQILINEKNLDASQWVFLQFDNQNRLKDSFCSCDLGKECLHQAAALFATYGQHTVPLHKRFEDSIWNTLCKHLAQEIGFLPDALQEKGNNCFVSYTQEAALLFSIQMSSSV